MLPRLALTLAVAPIFYSQALFAQVPPQAETQQVAEYDAPAYIAGIDGTATLERDGRVETSALNMPLLSGDRVRTADGRVEVRFADGGRLYLDARTTVDFLSDDLIRLLDGRVRVAEVRTQDVSYRIDSAAGSARLLQPGDYRVALLHGSPANAAAGQTETQLELAVTRGAGEIFTDNGTTPVRAGERAYASAALAPSYAYAFNAASADEFDRWIDLQRGTVYAASSQSAQYLPADIDGYASTFDQYGDWRYQQEYGYVWYPRVASDWRPYYNGRWASYPRYGWTWIAADRFGWPTHHYGRWGFSANAWFWIPSSRWSPAYVSWGYADDYVSWCPLGWNNRAVISINIFGGSGYYSSSPRYYSAWTIVPRGSFGRGYAYTHAVSWDRFRNQRPRFSEGRAPGYSHDSVIGRNAAPIRYAGTRAATGRGYGTSGNGVGTRAANPGGTPRYINRGDQIVRSQTGRPTPPRDTAVTRGSPQSAPRSEQRPYARPDAAGSRQTVPYSAPASRADAAPRALPYGGAQRERRAWDNPVYRPPAADTPARGYERTTPRQQAPASMPSRAYERTAPREQAPAAMPSRSYERTAPREQAAPQPRAYERPNGGGSPRQSGGYDRPSPPRQAPSRESAAPRGSGGSGHAESRGGGSSRRGGGRR